MKSVPRTPRRATAAWLVFLASSTAVPRARADQALTLGAAIDLALRANAGLAAVRAGHDVSAAGVRIAGAVPNPTFDFEHTRSTPHDTLLVTEALPLWRRGRAVSVARGELALADLEIEGAQLQLRHDVRLHYFGYLRAERERAIGLETLENARRLAQIAEERFAQGDVAELEVKQARLGAARAEAALATLESQIAVAGAELDADLGRPRDAPVALAGRLEERPALPAPAELVTAAVTEGRPARELRRRRATEELRLRLARAEALPELAAGVGAELDDPDFASGLKWTLSIGLPLLDRKAGERAQAHATLVRIALEEQALRVRVETAMLGAFARLDAADRQVRLYEASIRPAARELLELYREAYGEGTLGILAVIEVQKSAREVETEYAQALLEWQTALADLEAAAGLALAANEVTPAPTAAALALPPGEAMPEAGGATTGRAGRSR